MPALPMPFEEVIRAVKAWHDALDEGYPSPHVTTARGVRTAATEAAHQLDIDPKNASAAMQRRLDTAVALGVSVREWRAVDSDYADAMLRRYRSYDTEFQAAEARLTRPGRSPAGGPKLGGPSSPAAGHRPASRAPSASATVVDRPAAPAPAPSLDELVDQVVPTLRRGPATTLEIAERLRIPEREADLLLQLAHSKGASINQRGGKWHLDAAPALGITRQDMPELTTDRDGWLTFAACGDQHLCSKYARLDCLNDYYDEVERREIPIVLNAGNWIDGEASFNMHDLEVHGMDAQMQYLAKHYPQRTGVSTWAITGADHEGWYARREGVDVGRYAANTMEAAGRKDWRDMGYMEAFIRVIHAGSGAGSMIHLVHPGGGSAYALSYAAQKMVESYDGGDKPACLLLGHYHKSGYNLIRNVHTAQTGCFQDQTVFMRQRKLSAHVGGCFMRIHVDPRTGAFDECSYTFRNYFVRDYYNGRWSQHGTANLAARLP